MDVLQGIVLLVQSLFVLWRDINRELRTNGSGQNERGNNVVSYRLPEFNVDARVRLVDLPPGEEGDWAYLPHVQLYVVSRKSIDYGVGVGNATMPETQLRYPYDEEPEEYFYAECPADSGRFYKVMWQEYAHLGFPNQYLVAGMIPCCPSGEPCKIAGCECTEPVPEGLLLDGGTRLDVDLSSEGAVLVTPAGV